MSASQSKILALARRKGQRAEAGQRLAERSLMREKDYWRREFEIEAMIEAKVSHALRVLRLP